MISVCIATYNGEKYIAEQLNSILSQIGKDDEVLVSDDGSTDGTIAVIKSINDLRIKVLPPPIQIQQTSRNEWFTINKITANFLNAIKYAKGDTVYLSDQDDVWLPDKVGVCEEILRNHEVIVHTKTVVDQNLNYKVQRTTAQKDIRKASFLQSLRLSHFQGACMAFTKRVCDKIKKNSDLILESNIAHDHAIGYVVLAYFGARSVCFEPKSLILYRRHGNNVSPTGEKSRHSLYFKIKYRIDDILLYSRLLLRKLTYSSTVHD